MPKMLRLRAKPGLLYPHLQREEAGTRAFLGHRHGVVMPGPDETGALDVFGFVATDEIVELPLDKFASEYAKACADGDLVAADAETAAICRQLTGRVVPFELPHTTAPDPAPEQG